MYDVLTFIFGRGPESLDHIGLGEMIVCLPDSRPPANGGFECVFLSIENSQSKPTIAPGYIVVMDNLPTHREKEENSDG